MKPNESLYAPPTSRERITSTQINEAEIESILDQLDPRQSTRDSGPPISEGEIDDMLAQLSVSDRKKSISRDSRSFADSSGYRDSVDVDALLGDLRNSHVVPSDDGYDDDEDKSLGSLTMEIGQIGEMDSTIGDDDFGSLTVEIGHIEEMESTIPPDMTDSFSDLEPPAPKTGVPDEDILRKLSKARASKTAERASIKRVTDDDELEESIVEFVEPEPVKPQPQRLQPQSQPSVQQARVQSPSVSTQQPQQVRAQVSPQPASSPKSTPTPAPAAQPRAPATSSSSHDFSTMGDKVTPVQSFQVSGGNFSLIFLT